MLKMSCQHILFVFLTMNGTVALLFTSTLISYNFCMVILRVHVGEKRGEKWDGLFFQILVFLAGSMTRLCMSPPKRESIESMCHLFQVRDKCLRVDMYLRNNNLHGLKFSGNSFSNSQSRVMLHTLQQISSSVCV